MRSVQIAAVGAARQHTFHSPPQTPSSVTPLSGAKVARAPSRAAGTRAHWLYHCSRGSPCDRAESRAQRNRSWRQLTLPEAWRRLRPRWCNVHAAQV
eukprot:7383012-Prymnesium_polylepis.2